MLKYIVKRIGMALATLLVIIFVLFVLVRIMPGNPFPSERMSATQIANKRAEMGLDDPILLQFVRYMKNVLRGDFGKGSSLYNGAPIKTVLSSCVSNSFRIGGLAIPASLPPVAFNAVIIGIEIAVLFPEPGSSAPLWLACVSNGISVGVGALIKCTAQGVLLVKILEYNNALKKIYE